MAYAKIEDRRAASSRNYYENKQVYIDKSRARKKRLYNGVVATAKDRPCADCHLKFPLVCMDFDHVLGEKEFNIASGYEQVSLERLLKEIAKCEVVCANCHRIRTAKRVSRAVGPAHTTAGYEPANQSGTL